MLASPIKLRINEMPKGVAKRQQGSVDVLILAILWLTIKFISISIILNTIYILLTPSCRKQRIIIPRRGMIIRAH
ncbi:hypothetical protein Xmau_02970 [Xenorhabdus mauleonii]|uniref:Uncharacterized protein n=1 Tax=Xenorhabdus mauleonii TaxID=351675 RepID=A0A1I3T742_9GAMM|nr:hypothetical protein Xmau_02970 [Xenorhabdus mauleonii]SFJ66440.1 hypothetical protein SAMN05421680_11313 [Xenorhabdus mauleonii]